MTNRGLAYWSAAIDGPASITLEAHDLLAAHPRFEEACRLLSAIAFETFNSGSVFARATKDISRFFFGYFALYLDARGGLTLSSIRDLCSELGLASPGRAHAILLRLRTLGFVRRAAEQKDRRWRHYVPTEELKTALRERHRREFAAMALIEPDVAKAAERIDEPEFFKAFMLKAGEGLIEVAKNGSHDSVIFTDRNAGMLILLDIANSGQTGDVYPPRGPVKMSVTELASKYEVSRSHVLKLLRDAEGRGLLKRDPDTQTGVLSDALRKALIDVQISQLVGAAVCAHAAILATAGTRAVREVAAPVEA